jgi:ribosome-associated protein
MNRLSDAKKSPEKAVFLNKALCAAQAAIDKKALGPVLIDLTEAKSYTDYLLVASAPGPRAVRAIAENVQEVMAEHGFRPIGVEGVTEGRWALLDYGELVLHIFDQPLREFYDLEGMWFDAPRIPLEVPKDQELPRPGMYEYDEQDYSSSSA